MSITRVAVFPPHYAIVISTAAGGPKDYTPLISVWNEIAKSSGSDILLLQHFTAEQFVAKVDVPEAKFDSISGERPDLWHYIHEPAYPNVWIKPGILQSALQK
jgi:alpha-mannosidase